MRTVPLAAVPNQEFTVTIDDVRWVVGVKTARGVTAVNISREGVTLLTGSRALAGEPLIPYAYLQTGNFVFVTLNDALPEYSLFGVSQFLVYLSADEIAALQENPPTYDDLSPFVPSFLTTDDGFYLTTDTGEILTDD